MSEEDFPRNRFAEPGQPAAAYLVEGDRLRPLAIVPSAVGAPKDLDAKPFFAMLAQAERLSKMVGDVGRERLRVSAIMNSPEAQGQLALAWKLAEATFDPEAAIEILRRERSLTAPHSPDPGAAFAH